MPVDDVTPPLFDRLAARDVDDPDVTVFVGSPTSSDDETWADTAAIVSGVRAGCDRAGAGAEEPWLVTVRDGDSAPSADPAQIRDHVRREIVERADGAVFVLTRPSVGCGREMAWAISLGVPVLLLVSPGDEVRPHMGPTSWETHVWVAPAADAAAAEAAVAAWLTEHRAMIQTGSRRRTRPQNESEALRIACAAAWNGSLSEERERVARATHTSREHVVAVLSSPTEFAAARASLVLAIAHQLGIWHLVEPPREIVEDTAPMEITAPMWQALDEAIISWAWDGQTVARAVEAGLEELRDAALVTAGGGKQRSPNPTSRYGWREILRRRPRAT